jgi:hypothetical protein
MCEVMHGRSEMEPVNLDEPAYLHFKWAKETGSALQAWPDDWDRHEHFCRLIQRKQVAGEYRGPVPRCL